MRCWCLLHAPQQGSGQGIRCLHKQSTDACADPENFVRGGPTFFRFFFPFFFFFGGGGGGGMMRGGWIQIAL